MDDSWVELTDLDGGKSRARRRSKGDMHSSGSASHTPVTPRAKQHQTRPVRAFFTTLRFLLDNPSVSPSLPSHSPSSSQPPSQVPPPSSSPNGAPDDPQHPCRSLASSPGRTSQNLPRLGQVLAPIRRKMMSSPPTLALFSLPPPPTCRA